MANLWLGFWVIGFFLLGSLMDEANGSIHEYKNKGFTKLGDASYFDGGSEGLYASEFLVDGSSADTPPLKGNSFIRFEDISFLRSKESAIKQNSTQASAGLVEAILFEAKQKDAVGGSSLKTENMCCTQALADASSCNLGEVVTTSDPNDPQGPKRIPTFFKTGEQEAVAINRTGWYTVYFMTCDPELDGTIIRGRTVWKNPDGYLPGEKVHFKTFDACMFWAYALLALVLFTGFVLHWNHLIQLHLHITVVVVLAMCESGLRYYEFTALNSTGISPVDVSIGAVIFSSLKMYFSSLLLLVITTGSGVVMKPIVGNIEQRLLFLGVACFVLAEAIGVAEHLGIFSENELLFIKLLWAIVESCTFQWTFKSLWSTLQKLKIYFTLSEFWQLELIITASWYILAYALLLLICLFWAPSDKLTRYLYIADVEDVLEEEGVSLMKTEDGDAERRTLLDAFIIFFGNIPRGRHENPT